MGDGMGGWGLRTRGVDRSEGLEVGEVNGDVADLMRCCKRDVDEQIDKGVSL